MEEKVAIKPQIKEMQPKQILAFPIESINNVRVYCSDLGATLKRLYKTRKSIDGSQVEVMRVY